MNMLAFLSLTRTGPPRCLQSLTVFNFPRRLGTFRSSKPEKASTPQKPWPPHLHLRLLPLIQGRQHRAQARKAATMPDRSMLPSPPSCLARGSATWRFVAETVISKRTAPSSAPNVPFSTINSVEAALMQVARKVMPCCHKLHTNSWPANRVGPHIERPTRS